MYSAGFLKHRITIQNRGNDTSGDFGKEEGAYADGNTYWGNVTFVKGMNAMREGIEDAYAKCMIRMRYHSDIDDDTRFKYNGQIYKQIAPAIILKQEDEIQVECQRVEGL